MAENVKTAKDRVLMHTLDVLDKTLVQMPLKNSMPDFIRIMLRETILEKLITLWDEDNVDIFNVITHLKDLKEYSNKSYMFDYKLGECINYIKGMIECSKPNTINLN
jgi:hypothetical protein